MNSFDVINMLSDSHLEQLVEMYQEEWWTKGRNLDQTTRIVTNSTIVIGLINTNNDLIAFTRVLSDKMIKAIIFDVIVKSEYRGLGLGDELMELIISHPDLSDVKHFELYCLESMMPFYQKRSFRSLNAEQHYMRKENTKPLEK